MEFQTAQICLNTNNSTGNADRTSFTWNNINLRNALGEMYDKYDLYNLVLDVIINDNALTGYNATESDKQALIRISGLPFKNFTYNTNLQSSGVILGNYTYPNSGLSNRYYTNDSYVTFGKNQDICSITVDMLRISDLTLCKPASTRTFPELVLWFSVYGINKDKGNLNGSRIDNLK
jgi:hypothetical protein